MPGLKINIFINDNAVCAPLFFKGENLKILLREFFFQVFEMKLEEPVIINIVHIIPKGEH